MSETISQTSIQNQVLALALSSPERLSVIFCQYRDLDREEVVRACIIHLSEHGLDQGGRLMVTWLRLSAEYLPAMLDPKLLSLEAARRVAAILHQADQQCFLKLVNLSDQSDSLFVRRLVSRALELVDVFTNKDTLIPWLRKLTNSPDTRICSKAVKALCELRPNQQLIERQLQSPDERIRANTLEAIWHHRTAGVEPLFRRAVHYRNHRVVANALVGLYLIGDEAAFDHIAKLAEHPSPMFRRAMIWALGYIRDRRGIPILESLSSRDESPAVRNKALKALASFVPTAPDTEQLPTSVTESLEPTPKITEEAVPVEEAPHSFKLTMLR